MKKYKVLKELPLEDVGEIIDVESGTFVFSYPLYRLVEGGFIKEVRDIDLFEDELKKLMVKYGVIINRL